MSSIEIRPRFRREVKVAKEVIRARAMELLDQQAFELKGTVADHHIFLRVPEGKQHFWSPQMTVSLQHVEEGTILRGVCGPKPSIWMMFVFFYSFLGFVAMIIMVMGFSQMNLGLSAGILWLLPVIILIVGLMYFSARTGQRLARAEMERMYGFIDSMLK